MTPASDSADDTPPAMPRWVKAFLGIIVVVVVLLVVLKVIGGGGHGPRRHMGSGDSGQSYQSHR